MHKCMMPNSVSADPSWTQLFPERMFCIWSQFCNHVLAVRQKNCVEAALEGRRGSLWRQSGILSKNWVWASVRAPHRCLPKQKHAKNYFFQKHEWSSCCIYICLMYLHAEQLFVPNIIFTVIIISSFESHILQSDLHLNNKSEPLMAFFLSWGYTQHNILTVSRNSWNNLRLQRNAADSSLKSPKSSEVSVWWNDREIKIRGKQGEEEKVKVKS